MKNSSLEKTVRNIRNIATYAPHRVYAVLLISAAVVIPSLAIFAYGPDRPTYTIEQPADHITFNSITNNPNWGDERNSVLVRPVGATNNDWRDDLNVEDGKEYEIKVLVHNNAAANLNLTATNVRVNADIPTTAGTSATIQSAIMSDNSQPNKIWDHVTLNSDKRFNVAYVPGSARYFNNINNSAGFAINDGDLISQNGALVGYNSMDGNIPGCFQYSGFMYYKVKIYGELTANYEMSKQVRKHVEGQKGNWSKSVTVKPEDKVDYLIQYKNTGTANQNNVVVKDALPTKLSYNNGTTKLFNESNPAPNGMVTSDNLVTPSGINIGNYAPENNALVTFTATTPKAKDVECGNNTYRNTAYVETDNGNKQDTADVVVTKDCKDTPIYTCDMIEATKISQLEYSFNVKVSAKNATAKQVTIDFGDGQTATRDLKSLPVSHTYANAGQYTIITKASFEVDGKTVTNVTSETCKTVIDTTSPTVVTTGSTSTPTTPEVLPSTGPAEVFAGVLAASALGLGIQQWYASRKAVESALHHQ